MKLLLSSAALSLIFAASLNANPPDAVATRHGQQPHSATTPPYACGPLSADGRYVVFSSTSDGLVPDDHNAQEDVFRYDRETGTMLLVSVNDDNSGSGDFASFSPVISADGARVAFVSDATNLSKQDHNGLTDVFLRDLNSGATTLISVNSSGTNGGNGRSFRPQMSADGGVVVFESEATDLVALDDANGDGNDVFARDRAAGVTRLVSVNARGTGTGDRASVLGGISADGRTVVFESAAGDLTLAAGSGIRNVFARDLVTGVTALLSLNQAGTGSGNGDSFDPVISADGAVVAFASSASDLTADDGNGAANIFVRHRTTDVTELASVNRDGVSAGNGDSFGPRLSADGTIVAFNSLADDLVTNDSNGSADVFVRNLTTRITTLISRNLPGTGSANAASDGVALSADGMMVAFSSTATDLTDNPLDGAPNLFVHDRATGLTSLATRNQSGGGSGNDPAVFLDPAISGNGAVLEFRSTASDLVADSLDGPNGVFLYELTAPPANLKGQGGQLNPPGREQTGGRAR